MNRPRISVVIAPSVFLPVGCTGLDVTAPPDAMTPGETTMINSEGPTAPSEGETPLTEQGASPGSAVFFPQQQPGPMGYPDAWGGGKLVVDEEGCLRTKYSADDPGEVILWPSGFELDTTGGKKMRVLNRNGRVVARVDEEVVMGGGAVARKTLEGNDVLDERTRQELFERCPEPPYYFLAKPEMHLKR